MKSGIISTQQGRGTYILEMPPPEVDGTLRRQALEELTRRYLADAERLGVSAELLDEVFTGQVEQWKRLYLLETEEKLN